jgi:hypothetical protein
VVPPVPTETWGSAKDSFSDFVRTGGGAKGREYLERAAGRSVRAQGGARTAAGAARAGRRTAGTLAGFLGAVAAGGVAAAARSFGVASYVGRDAWSFLSDLIDSLGPDGATLDDNISRRALAETLSELLGDEDALASADNPGAMTIAAISVAVEQFIARYVYIQLLELLGSRLYERPRSEGEVRRLEQDVRGFVFETVRLSIRDADLTRIDLAGPEGRRLFEDAFAEGYGYLEQLW